MRQKTTTIRDVARNAGVSVSTVSHVLNGNDRHVSSAVRQRVLEVVENLKYRPNAIARSMVKRKTATIGLVFNEIENTLFVPVIDGVNEVLQPAGYHMVLASAPDVRAEIEVIETLRAQQVDGFIFMALSSRFATDHLVRLKDDGVPCVVINRYVDDEGIDQILLDDWGAGYSATRHLLDLGHRRIGTVSGPIYSEPLRWSAVERHRGWREALDGYGLESRPEWSVVGDYTYEGGYRAIEQLLSQIKARELARPDALFVASDIMAMGTLKALHEAGVRVPQDIALVAIGDPPFAPYTIPALTTLALPMPEAGRRAAHILLDWLTNGRPARAQRITLSFSFTVRESCGALPRSR
ncbi:MAG TPA: LacI family DNA-binding transcriptional regulator [Ktedonobacteraceae bacterium]